MKKKKQNNFSYKIRETLVSYFKSQFIIFLVTSAVFFLVLTCLNVRHALALSLITGAFSAVPILGMMTASLVTLVSVILDGRQIFGLPVYGEAILIILLYIVMNQIVDWVISPFIMGKTLKIHPLMLFSVMIPSMFLFGAVGAVLAAPLAAILKVIWETSTQQNRKNN